MTAAILIAIACFSVACDQLLKYLAVQNLMGGETVVLIPDFLELTFVTNDGAAGGILSGGRWVFVAITLAAVVLGIFAMAKFSAFKHWPERIAITLILAGGMGNLIDRVFHPFYPRAEVVDFLRLWIIPVFNFADACATVGAVLLVCMVLFRRDPPKPAFCTENIKRD